MRTIQLTSLVALLIACVAGCGASTMTRVGGVTSTNPFCVGFVHTSGVCAVPRLNATKLPIGQCVRVTYRATDTPGRVTILKLSTVLAAQHRTDCPA